jgi:hypothetical protein
MLRLVMDGTTLTLLYLAAAFGSMTIGAVIAGEGAGSPLVIDGTALTLVYLAVLFGSISLGVIIALSKEKRDLRSSLQMAVNRDTDQSRDGSNTDRAGKYRPRGYRETPRRGSAVPFDAA